MSTMGRDAAKSLELHKALMDACAKHDLSGRDTVYSLCITMHLVAQTCGLPPDGLNRIMEMLANTDLTPLLAASGIFPEDRRD